MEKETGKKLLETYCISCQETCPTTWVYDANKVVKAIYRNKALETATEIGDIDFIKKCKDCYKRSNTSILEERGEKKKKGIGFEIGKNRKFGFGIRIGKQG